MFCHMLYERFFFIIGVNNFVLICGCKSQVKIKFYCEYSRQLDAEKKEKFRFFLENLNLVFDGIFGEIFKLFDKKLILELVKVKNFLNSMITCQNF